MDVLQQVQSDDVHFEDLQFTDILGNTKSVTITTARLDEAIERGVWFDGSSIQGFARIHDSDMFLVPDANTYRVLPWTSEERRRARLNCDIKRPNGSYFVFSRSDDVQTIRADIVLALEAMGMVVEASHHEVAVGQHEIDFEYADALTATDNAVSFKYTVKAIATKHGAYATFMPKPIFGANGSGMHTHQSLMDSSGTNAFYDPRDDYKLSETAYGFIAGQLEHARALAAVVAPTVNSYKRLTPGYEHLVGTDQPFSTDPYSALRARSRTINTCRATLPGPIKQSVPRFRQYAPRRAGWH